MLGMSFPSDQKLFNIRFAVINYLAGKRNQFVYKLEGFETEWNYSRHVSFARASYSNLPPGEYVFKVKACNNNGKWSEATTELFCAHHSDVVSDLVGKDAFHLLFCRASRFCDLIFLLPVPK